MIKTVAHLADIHISNKLTTHEYTKKSLESTIFSLKNTKPGLIIIVGDLFHDFIRPTNEVKAMAGWFLRECSKIAKVFITQGNHDCNIKSSDRLDSIKTIVDILNDDNIVYLNTSDFVDVENVTLCVWHHSEKMSPWVKYPEYTKDNQRVYIDLFHDPINSSKTYFGREFNEDKYVSLSDFKGDMCMLGDIHQRQFFKKDGKLFGAYSSTLFQNNYGESVDGHGYLIWDIEDKNNLKVEEYETDNDFVYINYKINEGFDYSDIKINITPKNKTHLKIHWRDYKSNITPQNERLIRAYIKDNYPSVIELKFEKDRINNTVIEETDYIKKNIKNIYDKSVQQEIFKQFLIDKNYKSDVIDEVLILDDLISKRLQTTFNNVTSNDWELISFYVDNYRSHGDKTEVNWDKMNGVWQIKGQNGKGKTNLLSSICYLFYGKTLETLKRESNGDNRFINNKRDLNYCEVGGVLRIDSNYYKLIRKTERVYNKTKTEITKTPTTIQYFRLDNVLNVIENETDNEKTQTQTVISNSVGTFEDFLRTCLVNGDTLNNLLSMDEAVFMDSILRDSGLDIFEKKLEEYTKYKKENYKKESKIVINIADKKQEIDDLNASIENDYLTITNLENDIELTNKRLINGNEVRDNELKKLNPIDTNLQSLNIQKTKDEINKLALERLEKEREIGLLDEQINNMKETYDIELLNTLTKEKESVKVSIVDLKNNIKGYNTEIENIKHKISVINGEILTHNKEIESFNNMIDGEKSLLNNKITHERNKITSVISNINNKISLIKEEIELLEKSKICPSCNRELDSDGLSFIQEKIQIKKDSIASLEQTINKNSEIEAIETTIREFENQIANGNQIIKGYLDNIDEKKNQIILKEKNNITLKETIPTIEQSIETTNTNISSLENKLDEILTDISKVELDKIETEKRQKFLDNKNNIPIIIENIDLKINNQKRIIEDYQLNEQKILENQKIQANIDKYNLGLKTITEQRDGFLGQLNFVKNSQISGKKQKIADINDLIEKFLIQERKEQVSVIYQECLHREGLPKIILLKLRDDINNEILNLLSELDFTVYFDDNMVLKMYNNVKPESIMNVIGGCGMERTFVSVILRLALRNINNRSVGNILFLDEITGKLLDESVSKFFNLIHKMKQNIDKIVIIEHAYSEELHPDHIINVTANELGISSFTINNN